MAPPTTPGPSVSKPPPKPKPKPKPTTAIPPKISTTIIEPSTSAPQPISSTTDLGANPSPSVGPDSGRGPPPETSTSTSSPQDSAGTQGNRTSSSGMIIGASVGAVVLAIVLLGFVFIIRKKRRLARQSNQYNEQSMGRKYIQPASPYGLGDGSDVALHQQQQVYHSSRQISSSKQPGWWVDDKSPLEYYRQVPPREELKRFILQEDQGGAKKEDQSSALSPLKQMDGSGNISNLSLDSTVSQTKTHTAPNSMVAAKSFALGSKESSREPSEYPGDMIALSPTSMATKHVLPEHLPSSQPPLFMPTISTQLYQQHQYQQPRISTHGLRRPSASSPIQSPNSITSPSSSVTLFSNSMMPFPPKTSSNTPVSPVTSTPPSDKALYSYRPPPPSGMSSLGPIAPLSPTLDQPQPGQKLSEPSPGFYDFLFDTEDRMGDEVTNNSHDEVRAGLQHIPDNPPPPVPKATRPMSVVSVASLRKATSMGELVVDASAPAVPPLPKRDEHKSVVP